MLNIEKMRHSPARKFKTAPANMIQSSKSVKYVFTWVNLGVMSGSIFWDFSKFLKLSQMNFWWSQMMSGLSRKLPNITKHVFKFTWSFKFDENLKNSKLTKKIRDMKVVVPEAIHFQFASCSPQHYGPNELSFIKIRRVNA